MFGFLKPKPAPKEPVVLSAKIEIEAPARDVFGLIDWADPRNAKRQMGHLVTPDQGATDRFEMVLNEMPDHRFEMIVTDNVPGQTYGFTTLISPAVGRLALSHEIYTLEVLSEHSCLLELVLTMTLIDGLKMREYEEELMLILGAAYNAVAKFKIHAEQGIDGIRAVEHRLIV